MIRVVGVNICLLILQLLVMYKGELIYVPTKATLLFLCEVYLENTNVKYTITLVLTSVSD